MLNVRWFKNSIQFTLSMPGICILGRIYWNVRGLYFFLNGPFCPAFTAFVAFSWLSFCLQSMNNTLVVEVTDLATFNFFAMITPQHSGVRSMMWSLSFCEEPSYCFGTFVPIWTERLAPNTFIIPDISKHHWPNSPAIPSVFKDVWIVDWQ